MFTELTIKGETYKLRLTTKGCISLEKALGCNPLQLFMDMDDGKLPKVTDITIMLQVMLSQSNHGINIEKTYDFFDAYLEDGHNMFDIIPVFMEVFQEAGFVSKEQANEEDEKN